MNFDVLHTFDCELVRSASLTVCGDCTCQTLNAKMCLQGLAALAEDQ